MLVPNSRAGRCPQGGFPCTATNLLMDSGSRLLPAFPIVITTGGQDARGKTIGSWSMVSCGICTPAHPGRTRPSDTARGRRSMTASIAGVRTAPGPRSSTRCSYGWIGGASSLVTCGWSMPQSFGPVGPPPARKKKQEPAPTLAGPEALRLQEPPDHALGRSQGGFGTKVHLGCEGEGTVVALWVTPGQRHESQAFSIVLLRAQRPRQVGRPRWPQRVAGDKGYSYPAIGDWPQQHRTDDVLPSPKYQP